MKSRPRVLVIEEIKHIIESFIKASYRAKIAGYDGVELHAAHGYLLNQFISPYTNKRTDQYGGSLENRARIVVEIINGIKSSVGSQFPVIVRMSVKEFVHGGLDIPESTKFARVFQEIGADALHITTGIHETLDKNVDTVWAPEAWRVPLAEKIKEKLNIPTIAVGVIRDPGMAEQILSQKKADFIAVGRNFLSEPTWPRKVMLQMPIRKCVSCGFCSQHLVEHKGLRCAINPELGRKGNEIFVTGLNRNSSIAVVGGGPSGMVAAINFAKNGFQVSLYEQEEHLGGMLDVVASVPGKDKWQWFRNYLLDTVGRLNINVELNHKIDSLAMLKEERVVVATGGLPVIPNIAGIDIDCCADISSFIRQSPQLTHRKIVVYGARGSGLEAALLAASNDNEVVVISRSPKNELGTNLNPLYRASLIKKLEDLEVLFKFKHEVLNVETGEAVLKDHQTNQIIKLQLDYFIYARGFNSNRSLLSSHGKKHFICIGSCYNPGNIADAVQQGYFAIRKLEMASQE